MTTLLLIVGGWVALWTLIAGPAAALFERCDPRYREDRAALCPACRAAVRDAERRTRGLRPATWPELCARDAALMDAWCVLDPNLPRPPAPPIGAPTR